MISTRRIVTVVGLSVTGLAALPASAAGAGAPAAGGLKPLGVLDSLATSGIPAGRQAEVPTVSEQLSALHHVRDLRQLGQLNQVTGLLSPVFGLVPAVR
ncbi:hypothetical protein ACF1B0_32830 [Streptomyces anandii]|uniref:hypothetical protein n=1 Tax=Streptomyces anandii TaxID=285454 RepID=UPI0036F646CA